jgi:hypothetical protein
MEPGYQPFLQPVLLGDSAYPLKTQEFSSYLRGNALCLHYKDQPVNAVYYENHMKHTNTLCRQNKELYDASFQRLCAKGY